MITLPKLLLIVLLGLGGWFVVRMINRLPRDLVRRKPAAAAPRSHAAIEAEDLVACTACGSYVAASARSCGKAGCPRPR